MIEHPYQNLNGGRWLVGNLHTHTTASDGERDHQAVIDDYAGRGYGFLAITDHDIYTSLEDYEQYDAQGMILVPGNEISANGPHVLHVGDAAWVAPHEDRQQVIDEVNEVGRWFYPFQPSQLARQFQPLSAGAFASLRGLRGLGDLQRRDLPLGGQPLRDESLGHAAECGQTPVGVCQRR